MVAFSQWNCLDKRRSPELAALKLGDEAAWKAFTSRYGQLVAHWARASHVVLQDIPDVVEDTFLRVLRNLEQFVPNGRAGCFVTWLKRLSGSAVGNYFRAVQRHHDTIVTTVDREQYSRHGLLSETDRKAEASGQLSDEFRRLLDQVQGEFGERAWTVFWRNVVNDVPNAVIAADLSMSLGAVRTCKYRVLKRLRALCKHCVTIQGTSSRFPRDYL
jgi:RNA polymerase sigma factor (sigma-70 family)